MDKCNHKNDRSLKKQTAFNSLSDLVGVRCSRVVTFAAIRLRGPGFKPRPGQKFETRLLLHSYPSGGEGV